MFMTIVKAVTESRGPFSQSRLPPSFFVSAARAAGTRAHHAGSRFDLLVLDQLLNGLKRERERRKEKKEKKKKRRNFDCNV